MHYLGPGLRVSGGSQRDLLLAWVRCQDSRRRRQHGEQGSCQAEDKRPTRDRIPPHAEQTIRVSCRPSPQTAGDRLGQRSRSVGSRSRRVSTTSTVSTVGCAQDSGAIWIRPRGHDRRREDSGETDPALLSPGPGRHARSSASHVHPHAGCSRDHSALGRKPCRRRTAREPLAPILRASLTRTVLPRVQEIGRVPRGTREQATRD